MPDKDDSMFELGFSMGVDEINNTMPARHTLNNNDPGALDMADAESKR